MTWDRAIELAYLGSGLLLPLFYVPQISRLLKDDSMLASFSVSKAISQFALRVPTLLFAVVIVQHSFMTLVLTADIAGRLAEVVAAMYTLRRQGASTSEVLMRFSPWHALKNRRPVIPLGDLEPTMQEAVTDTDSQRVSDVAEPA